MLIIHVSFPFSLPVSHKDLEMLYNFTHREKIEVKNKNNSAITEANALTELLFRDTYYCSNHKPNSMPSSWLAQYEKWQFWYEYITQ